MFDIPVLAADTIRQHHCPPGALTASSEESALGRDEQFRAQNISGGTGGISEKSISSSFISCRRSRSVSDFLEVGVFLILLRFLADMMTA